MSEILALAQGRVAGLRKQGQNYAGLCPFHEEKTPSFSIHPEKEVFYCWGCGEKGGVKRFAELLGITRDGAVKLPKRRPRPILRVTPWGGLAESPDRAVAELLASIPAEYRISSEEARERMHGVGLR